MFEYKVEEVKNKFQIKEPNLYILKLKKNTAFCNAIRVALQTLTSRKAMVCYIEDFISTDANILYPFFERQLFQVNIEPKDITKLGFYAENKSFCMKPFGTYNLKLGDKPLDLEKYGIANYNFGFLLPGNKIHIKNIEIVDDQSFGIESFEWIADNYDKETEKGYYILKWRFYSDCLKIVCTRLIEIFQSYKDTKKFEGDIGPYALLIADYIINSGRDAFIKRELFSKDINTKIDADQKDINHAIDLIINDISILRDVKI